MASKERKAYMLTKGMGQFAQALGQPGDFGYETGKAAEAQANDNIARIAQEEYEKEQKKANSVFGLDLGGFGGAVKSGLSLASNAVLPVAGPAIVGVADDAFSGRDIDVGGIATDAAMGALPVVGEKIGGMLGDKFLDPATLANLSGKSKFLSDKIAPIAEQTFNGAGGVGKIAGEMLGKGAGSAAAGIFGEAGGSSVFGGQKKQPTIDTTGLPFDMAQTLQQNAQRQQAMQQDYEIQRSRMDMDKEEFGLRKKSIELQQRRMDQDYANEQIKMAQPIKISTDRRTEPVQLEDGSSGIQEVEYTTMYSPVDGTTSVIPTPIGGPQPAPVDYEAFSQTSDVYATDDFGNTKLVKKGEARPNIRILQTEKGAMPVDLNNIPIGETIPGTAKTTKAGTERQQKYMFAGKEWLVTPSEQRQLTSIIASPKGTPEERKALALQKAVELGLEPLQELASVDAAYNNYQNMTNVLEQNLTAQGIYTQKEDMLNPGKMKTIPAPGNEWIDKEKGNIANLMAGYQNVIATEEGRVTIPQVRVIKGDPAKGAIGDYVKLFDPMVGADVGPLILFKPFGSSEGELVLLETEEDVKDFEMLRAQEMQQTSQPAKPIQSIPQNEEIVVE